MFDQTGEKRAQFVKLVKKYRSTFVGQALNSYANSSPTTGTNLIELDKVNMILSGVETPAQLWDNRNEVERQRLYGALLLTLVEEANQLTLQSTEMLALKSTLEQIPDEVEDDDDDAANTPTPTPTSTTQTLLYHATPEKNIAAIKIDGLRKMGRRNVYFETDRARATDIAAKHGDCEISVISLDVDELVREGYNVRVEDFGWGSQWCCDSDIPAKYLIFE